MNLLGDGRSLSCRVINIILHLTSVHVENTVTEHITSVYTRIDVSLGTECITDEGDATFRLL